VVPQRVLAFLWSDRNQQVDRDISNEKNTSELL
jgi:hypothetical protein